MSGETESREVGHKARTDHWRVTLPRFCEKAMLVSGALFAATMVPPAVSGRVPVWWIASLAAVQLLFWLVYLVCFVRERFVFKGPRYSTRLWGVAMPVTTFVGSAVLYCALFGVPW